MDKEQRESREAHWVDAYRPVAEAALAHFLDKGEWPSVDLLQRQMDQEGKEIDVEKAIGALPTISGEVRGTQWRTTTIPLRFLKHMPRGQSLLGACFAIIQHGVAAYFSKQETPIVRSDDPELLRQVPGRPAVVWFRAGQLVMTDRPSLFAGGSFGDDWWEFQVNGPVARKMSGLVTITDYFDRQAAILEESARPLQGPPVPVEPTNVFPRRLLVFVSMPLNKSWSTRAFDVFWRAIADLRTDFTFSIYRTDTVDVSGAITTDVKDAIGSADVILADITEATPNVMWELGYAEALGKPTVVVMQDNVPPIYVAGWHLTEYSLSPEDDRAGVIAEAIRSAVSAEPE